MTVVACSHQEVRSRDASRPAMTLRWSRTLPCDAERKVSPHRTAPTIELSRRRTSVCPRIRTSASPHHGTSPATTHTTTSSPATTNQITMSHHMLYTLLLLLAVFSNFCRAVPKKYDATGGFVPSYEDLEDPETISSRLGRNEGRGEAGTTNKELTKEPKFGFISYGTPGQGYGTSIQSGGGLKIDLGGVVLGALIGLGAVLIIPKLLSVVVDKPVHEGYHTYGSYNAYGRSEESPATNVTSGIMHLLTQVDDALSKHNIDSTSCMQRAVCSYVKSATYKIANGSATSIDTIVDTVTRNSVLSVMLDGSSLKQALERGQQGANCGVTFPKCPFNKDTVYVALKSILPE